MSVYTCKTFIYVKSNVNCYKTNAEVYSYDTRKKNYPSAIPHHTSLYSTGFIYTGLKMYNVLTVPAYLKEMPVLDSRMLLKTSYICIVDEFLQHFQ